MDLPPAGFITIQLDLKLCEQPLFASLDEGVLERLVEQLRCRPGGVWHRRLLSCLRALWRCLRVRCHD